MELLRDELTRLARAEVLVLKAMLDRGQPSNLFQPFLQRHLGDPSAVSRRKGPCHTQQELGILVGEVSRSVRTSSENTEGPRGIAHGHRHDAHDAVLRKEQIVAPVVGLQVAYPHGPVLGERRTRHIAMRDLDQVLFWCDSPP